MFKMENALCVQISHGHIFDLQNKLTNP